MGTFSENLDCRWVGVVNGKVMWELLQPLIYTTDANETIIVPAGFRTDLATTPRILWWWIPPDWKYSKAAVIHDYLIVSGERPWEEANKLFYRGMRDLGVCGAKDDLMYGAVCFWRWFKLNILHKKGGQQ